MNVINLKKNILVAMDGGSPNSKYSKCNYKYIVFLC